MMGFSSLAKLLFAKPGVTVSIAAAIAAVVFFKSIEAIKAENEELRELIKTATAERDAAAEAAQQAVETAERLIEAERAAANRLADRMDQIGTARGECVDKEIPPEFWED